MRWHYKSLKKKILIGFRHLTRTKGQFGQIYAAVKQRRVDEKELQKQGVKNYKVEAEARMKAKLAQLNVEYEAKLKEKEDEDNRANRIVDDAFDDIFKDDTISISNKENETREAVSD